MRARQPAADPDLRKINDFVELVAASARSSRQRERVMRAAQVPLTAAGTSALRLIARHGPILVSDIARRLGVDQSTASRQVRPLEDEGLIVRTADPDDRRTARLAITDEGGKLLDRVRAVALNDFDVALADWSAADRALLADLLDRFRAGLLDAQVDDSGWSVRASGSPPSATAR